MVSETKWCNCCQRSQPLSEFWENYGYCKTCHRRGKVATNDMTRRKANRYNIPWTTEEDSFIRKNYLKMSDTEIAVELSRTRDAVTGRREKGLGLIKTAGEVVLEDITVFLYHTSPDITQITVSVQSPKLVVFAPSDTSPVDIEDAFKDQDVSLDLYIVWLVNKKRA